VYLSRLVHLLPIPKVSLHKSLNTLSRYLLILVKRCRLSSYQILYHQRRKAIRNQSKRVSSEKTIFYCVDSGDLKLSAIFDGDRSKEVCESSAILGCDGENVEEGQSFLLGFLVGKIYGKEVAWESTST
jgi:hypothetical protein